MFFLQIIISKEQTMDCWPIEKGKAMYILVDNVGFPFHAKSVST